MLIFVFMKPTLRKNWPKYVLQWGVLAALIFFLSGLAAKVFPKLGAADPEAYCPMGGLESLTTYLTRGSLPCSMSSTQILMGILMAASVVLLGKLFCAYLCPIGSVEDILTKLRKAFGFNDVEIREGSLPDLLLRLVKYGLLFWLFYATATSSELICKRIDPYYAIATGFKGEIVIWMSLTALATVIVCGFFVKRFFCRYICPLGAAANTFRFWLPLLLLAGLWWVLSLAGLSLQWWWLLAAFCILGYLLEVLYRKPKLQLLHVIYDDDSCTRRCYNCQKSCPYNIDIPASGGVVTHVDCTLCGECVATCPTSAVSFGAVTKNMGNGLGRFLPPVLAIALTVLGIVFGHNFEVPTIDEKWDIAEGVELQTMTVENLTSVHCYNSSMAFKSKMQKEKGVHGVRTYAASHTVVITYDPTVTSEEKILENLYEPSHFRVNSPDPSVYKTLRKQTIRTEHMPNRTDLNHLGLLMRYSGKKIFGLQSEYDCPLIIHVYSDPAEELDEAWFREIVEKKLLQIPTKDGGTKDFPLNFTFVRMEKGSSLIPIADYLQGMFDNFTSSKGDLAKYAAAPQYIYEIEDQNYEKPVIRRVLPYLSNYLVGQDGVIGVYVKLNDRFKPSLQIRFASPITGDGIWELLQSEKWVITNSQGETREVDAMMKFDKKGKVYSY